MIKAYKEVLMAKKRSGARQTAEKAVKKFHPAILLLAVLCLIIGIVAGVLVSRYLTKNDVFELNGAKTIQIALGDSFTDPGVHIVSFGRDISSKAEVGGDFSVFDESVEDIYQFVYTVDDVRWGEYQLVRTVIVGNPEGSEEFLNG